MQKSFVVDHRSRKNIISSIGIKFRSFKHALTKYHIIPFMNDPEHLKNPPDLYNFIQKEHWDKFVASRVSDEFQVCIYFILLNQILLYYDNLIWTSNLIQCSRHLENFNKKGGINISTTTDLADKAMLA